MPKGFQKGHKYLGGGARKGSTPWNKGKKGVMSPVWNKGKKGVQKSTRKGMNITHSGSFKPGKKHWNWKGGKCQRGKHEGGFYKRWTLKVFKRDNFTCQVCKKVGGNLEAHHLKSWKDYPKLRYKVDNGVTLCYECHKLTR